MFQIAFIDRIFVAERVVSTILKRERYAIEVKTVTKNHPETFAYFSDGVRVQGDFHFKEEEIGKWISAFK